MHVRVFLLAWLALGTVAPAHAEPSWKAELQRDLVQVKDGKYVIEKRSVCSVTNAPAETPDIRTRTYAEAPKDLVSRDNVVAFLTEANILTVLGLSSGGAELACRAAKEPFGKPDLETVLTMSAEGMDWEITNHRDGGTQRTTMSWSDMFPAGE